MDKVDAIFMADVHLRDDTPVCRTDNFWEAQWEKIKFINTLAYTHQCSVIVAGDIFHKSKSSQYLEAMAIKSIKNTTWIVIPGQHDLPSHSMQNYPKSSLAVLEAAGNVRTLFNQTIQMKNFSIHGFAFGQKITNTKAKVVLLHQMIHKDKPIHKSMESTAGLSLLKATDYDLIVCGDNHQSFVVEHKGRKLLNCGSMMRTTADQIDHIPVVWLWNREHNELEAVELPVASGVISREHLDIQEKKDVRMDKFMDKIDQTYEVGFSFEENLESYFRKNKTRNGIKEVIYESIQE